MRVCDQMGATLEHWLHPPSFSLGSGLVPHKKFINAFPVLARYSLLALEDNSRVIPRQVDDKHKAALEIITYVGMGLSILGNNLSVLVQWKWSWVRVSSCVTFILNLFRGIYLELRKRSRFETRALSTPILFSKRFLWGKCLIRFCFNGRDLGKQRPRMRINLTIALTLAQVAFLAGIDRSEHLVSQDNGGHQHSQ